jgi:hypothetical protein
VNSLRVRVASQTTDAYPVSIAKAEPVLTLFSIPKPFHGHVGMIQRNALRSWLKLSPRCEVILCGDDPGVAEIAEEFGVTHLPHVARNQHGTPLLNSALEMVEEIANASLIAFANADILFLSDLVPAVKRVSVSRFLLVGQRWDVDIHNPIDFSRVDWEAQLQQYVQAGGSLHAPAGSDYFIFPKGAMGRIPPFSVGRPGWDNWFIYRARMLGHSVIDATQSITAVHQNHDYSHLPEVTNASRRNSSNVRYNLEMLGDMPHFFTLYDATHLLTRKHLVPAWRFEHLQRRWMALPVLRPWTAGFVKSANWFIYKVIARVWRFGRREA